MARSPALLFLLRRYYGVPAVTVATIVLALAAIFIDALTPIWLNTPILFGLPLVLAGASGSRLFLWGLTLALVADTFIVYAFQIPPGEFDLEEPYFVNRALAAVALLVAASLVNLVMSLIDSIRARGNAAEEASGRKSHLLASVSHDVRTPLATIGAIAQLIQRSAVNEDPRVELQALGEDLGKNVMSISDLLTDALDISALESGRLALRESEFSLNELLTEERERYKPLFEAKGLSLSARPANPDVRVVADRIKLARIIGNLMNNALKFTQRGGAEMTVETAADRSILVNIADTGVGIAAQDLERIFEEFAQVSVGVPVQRGWGLGLAISRRLAELMGGTIEVRSQLDVGTVFTVRLPGRRAPRDPRADAEAQREE